MNSQNPVILAKAGIHFSLPLNYSRNLDPRFREDDRVNRRALNIDRQWVRLPGCFCPEHPASAGVSPLLTDRDTRVAAP